MDREEISRALEMAETAILGLRLVDGLDLASFGRRFGVSFDTVFAQRLAPLGEYGLVARAGDRIRLTERGLLLGNEVFERLLPEPATDKP